MGVIQILMVSVGVEEIWSVVGGEGTGIVNLITEEMGAGEVSSPEAVTDLTPEIQISKGIMIKVPDIEAPLLDVPRNLERTTGPGRGPEDTEASVIL